MRATTRHRRVCLLRTTGSAHQRRVEAPAAATPPAVACALPSCVFAALDGGSAPATELTLAAPPARRLTRVLQPAVAAGSNANKGTGPTKNTAKLDAETEELSRACAAARPEGCCGGCSGPDGSDAPLPRRKDERVSTELRQNLMKARLEKKLTQAQLAQQINELPKVVQDYEAGKAIPNQAVRHACVHV